MTIKGRGISWLLILNILCSFLLSLTILIRFFLPINQGIQLANYFLYLILFIALPAVAVFYLLFKAEKLRLSKKWKILCWSLLVVWVTVLVFGFYMLPTYEYVYIWIPVFLAYLLPTYWSKKIVRPFRLERAKILAVACFAIAILMPNLIALMASSQIIANASEMPLQDRVSYIDERIRSMTEYTWVFRSEFDSWKFLLSGAGECGEMAIASNNFIHSSGLISRIVDIPGEHDFVEVWANGEWKVADGSNLINRTAYGEIRIESVGSLSYALTVTEGSFIELTQYYVPTDIIVISVTKNGEPVANLPITLVRTGSLPATIPSSNQPFQTDVNGEVRLHLGATDFVGLYENTTKYYVICVNGSPTPYNVTSTGSGLTIPVNVLLK